MKRTAIIGGGPVGLAAAAHLLQRGEDPIIFEAGPEPAWAIRQWQHVRLFSPWEFNIDKAALDLLRDHGWDEPNGSDLPTGREFREHYLLPLASVPSLKKRIRLNAKVTSVSRTGRDKVKDRHRGDHPFVLNIRDSDGNEYQEEAAAVIDTSGTWFQPNPVGSSGIPAPGEEQNRAFIRYGIPDVRNAARAEYLGRDVAVVGSGHSAMQVVLDLIRLQEEDRETTVHWIMRSTALARVFGGGSDDQLAARGELGERARKAVEEGKVVLHTPFLLRRIDRIAGGENLLKITGQTDRGQKEVTVDRIVGTAGFRPDLDIIREVRTEIDPALESVADLAPLIDPNVHSCGSVPPHGVNELKHPDENFFIAGIKSYGRAPNFLLATGYEQVRSIAAWLTGDYESADRIELHLPETGVCSTDLILDAGPVSCCGGSAAVDTAPGKGYVPARENGDTDTGFSPAEETETATCCGGPAAADEEACCQLDAQAKAEGKDGCGC